MNWIEVAPGLVLDGEMYGLAAAGLRRHAPDVPWLTWAEFTTRERWLLVPDANRPELPWYKAEYAVLRTPERTVKVNVWTEPDRRKGDKPAPHSHTWPILAHVLRGSYSEDRYTLAGGAVQTETRQHVAGGINAVPLACWHEVTEVEPGTLTLMVCGKAGPGWGYLDPDTGKRTPSEDDPDREAFKALLADRNPHLR